MYIAFMMVKMWNLTAIGPLSSNRDQIWNASTFESKQINKIK